MDKWSWAKPQGSSGQVHITTLVSILLVLFLSITIPAEDSNSQKMHSNVQNPNHVLSSHKYS